MAEKKVNIAIIGLGFGAEFIPIYQHHPHANMYAICQRTESRLHQVGDSFGVEARYTDYEQVLADPKVDAVHINTPIHEHAQMSIAGLRAGKHVACTVPAATSIEELEQIVQAQESPARVHDGGKPSSTRASSCTSGASNENRQARPAAISARHHQQEMLGWPGYWKGCRRCITRRTSSAHVSRRRARTPKRSPASAQAASRST